MSPGAIDRLVLAAPVGLKPARGEILDVFYHSPQQLRELNVHDPSAVPEWEELFGRAPTPAELEIAERNREMTARLAWKPYMHNPRLERFLPRVTNPTLSCGDARTGSCRWRAGSSIAGSCPTPPSTCSNGAATSCPSSILTPLPQLVLDFLGGKARP
jgi:hypothetical protein